MELARHGISPEYLEARYADDRLRQPSFNGRAVLVAVAARVGKARLIDNRDLGTRGRPAEQGEDAEADAEIKIHRATITGCDADYVGSITIDPELMSSADLLVNEQVHVWDIDNGSRFVTYVIEGPRLANDAGQRRCRPPRMRRPQDHRRLVRRLDERDLETYSPIVVHVDDENEIHRVDSHPEVLLSEEEA